MDNGGELVIDKVSFDSLFSSLSKDVQRHLIRKDVELDEDSDVVYININSLIYCLAKEVTVRGKKILDKNYTTNNIEFIDGVEGSGKSYLFEKYKEDYISVPNVIFEKFPRKANRYGRAFYSLIAIFSRYGDKYTFKYSTIMALLAALDRIDFMESDYKENVKYIFDRFYLSNYFVHSGQFPVVKHRRFIDNLMYFELLLYGKISLAIIPDIYFNHRTMKFMGREREVMCYIASNLHTRNSSDLTIFDKKIEQQFDSYERIRNMAPTLYNTYNSGATIEKSLYKGKVIYKLLARDESADNVIMADGKAKYKLSRDIECVSHLIEDIENLVIDIAFGSRDLIKTDESHIISDMDSDIK